MIKAGIIGSTGYIGQEVLRLLLQHPQVEVSHITSQSYVGKEYSKIYKNYEKLFSKQCESEDIEAISKEADVIFVALPHGMAADKINTSVLSNAKVIDLGADFRLNKKDEYEHWYSTEHHNEELLSTAVYGLCEWNREHIKSARLIANPGCYATCSILSLSPLIKDGIIFENSIIVDAKSCVSGAGRTLDLGTHFSECNESVKAYKVASHRHTPEIEQELNKVGRNPLKISFTPHLIPMNRGILVTAYGTLKSELEYADVQAIYEKYYGKEYFIRLTNKDIFPETRWTKGSNFCDIGFTIDKRTNRVLVIGAIDNLIKGGAGQAVQNMNIMFGFDEKLGLDNIPIFPA